MKAEHKRMLQTRRLYAFENGVLRKEVPWGWQVQHDYVANLQIYTDTLWAAEKLRGSPPRVAFGPGTPHCGKRVSFCQGRTYIELVKGDRDYLILLHELVHASGPVNHGRMFVRRYLAWLAKYAGLDYYLLMNLAWTWRVDV